MIRDPKDFGGWPACPFGAHSFITELEVLPLSTLFSSGYVSLNFLCYK